MNKENRRIYSHHRSSQGQGKLEPLRVNIPVKKQIISTEEQPQQRKALQPAVTNTDRASIRVQHRPDPTKSKKRVASELVDERSVPSIIHDVRRNLKYQKHECIGLVKEEKKKKKSYATRLYITNFFFFKREALQKFLELQMNMERNMQPK